MNQIHIQTFSMFQTCPEVKGVENKLFTAFLALSANAIYIGSRSYKSIFMISTLITLTSGFALILTLIKSFKSFPEYGTFQHLLTCLLNIFISELVSYFDLFFFFLGLILFRLDFLNSFNKSSGNSI